MKNGVECYKDFFPYFKALKTNCVMQSKGVRNLRSLLCYKTQQKSRLPYFLP